MRHRTFAFAILTVACLQWARPTTAPVPGRRVLVVRNVTVRWSTGTAWRT